MNALKVVFLAVALGIALLVALSRERTIFPTPIQRVQSTRQPAVEIIALGKIGFALGDVAILNSGRIWAVGYDGHDPRRFFYSGDWGRTWEIKPVNSSGFLLEDIAFADAEHGWAVGGYGTILRTTDGGSTWEQMKSPSLAKLDEIRFFNAQIGYATGSKALWYKETDTYAWGVVALCTADGGVTWRKCYEDDSSHSLGGIVPLSEKVAVGSLDDHIIRTADGGLTWQVASEVVDYGPAFRHPDGTVWGSRSDGALFRSLDQGKTWQSFGHLPPFDIEANRVAWSGLAFADERRGIAVGHHGHLALTRDGGLTWTNLNMGINEDLRSVWLKGNQGLILGSENVYQIRVPD